MTYPKPWKSHKEQLDLLISRGLRVTSRQMALKHLERIGYYRLSGYWFDFRERSDSGEVLNTFKPDATFEDAVKLYRFDTQLRLLVLEGLESVEIALRVAISHTLGQLHPFAHTMPTFLHSGFTQKQKDRGQLKHQDWLNEQKRLISRSKETFVRHYKQKYNSKELMVWVACEVWSFGVLSKLFGGMREEEQDTIASQYGIGNGRVFASWLRSLSHLRNICAHHSRLWNRNIDNQPKLPRATVNVLWVADFENDSHRRARCYLLLRITRHLLQVINPDSSWAERMRAHLQSSFPDLTHLNLNLASMGVPDGWEADW